MLDRMRDSFDAFKKALEKYSSYCEPHGKMPYVTAENMTLTVKNLGQQGNHDLAIGDS